MYCWEKIKNYVKILIFSECFVQQRSTSIYLWHYFSIFWHTKESRKNKLLKKDAKKQHDHANICNFILQGILYGYGGIQKANKIYCNYVFFSEACFFGWETTCSQKKLTLVSEDTGCIISSLNFHHIFMGHTIYRQQEKNMLTLTYCNRPRD